MGWKSWTFFHILFFLTFLISGLAINLLQGLSYLLFPKSLFRRLNYYLQWIMYGQFIFFFDWWSSSEVRMYGPSSQIKEMQSQIGHEHAIILCNHHYETDWLFGWCIAERFRILGAAKVFMKAVLKYVPVLGWGWNLSDIIFVKRNWNVDQKLIPAAIQRLNDYPFPFWLLIYAEGTRFTKEKHLASQDFRLKSMDSNLPDLKHHLIPRTRGFYLTLMNLDFKAVPAIYDVTLVAQKETSSLLRVLNGEPLNVDAFVRRLPLDGVEKKEDSINSFLMKTYKEKDEFIDHFINSGHFGEGTESIHFFPKRRLHSLINAIVLNILVLAPFFYYVIRTFIYGSSFHIGFLIAIYSLLYFGLKKMIGITKFSKSSAYGNQKKQE
ncbi:1-acyl-sn-glycerol-3-phosphate acyltransferase delta [Lepeophtheirus salmonis]|uniref:1acylsnglycerol3-phosphate acyltransferase gamma-like [Nasonia vitripennis] n=1 Tax=Lepeophtheirus salmonis TaxID=72036 RepID=A0A0K2UC40_LEPSM|nr:1-acyl-sn-glycerol-3-phosphate acyltransferase delta-like [Lepeophtheirus salmonis]